MRKDVLWRLPSLDCCCYSIFEAELLHPVEVPKVSIYSS